MNINFDMLDDRLISVYRMGRVRYRPHKSALNIVDILFSHLNINGRLLSNDVHSLRLACLLAM
jgi:hypothetical protein